MTPAVSPELALDYLATLWVDLRSAVVLDDALALLAGDGGLADRARPLLAGLPAGEAAKADETGGGVLYAARSNTHAVAVVVNAEALEAVVVVDLLTVLDDLSGC